MLKRYLFVAVLIFMTACSAKANDQADIQGKVLFYSNRDGGKWGLYLYENKKVKFIAPRLGLSSWFSNGKKFLATSTSEVYVMDLSGKTLDVIRFEKGMKIIYPRMLRDDSGFFFIGKKLLKRPDGADMAIGTVEIYLYKFKDKSTRQLTDLKEIGNIFSYDIGPDDNWIALSWAPHNGDTRGILFSSKTKEQFKFDDFTMSLGWSPDGKTILYEGSNQNGKKVDRWKGLFSYDVATKKSTLINKSFGTTGFRMSPDGKKLIYSNWYQDGICLFTYDIATQKSELLLPLKQIGDGASNDSNPEWHA